MIDYHYSLDQEEHTHSKAPYEQRIVDALQEQGYQVSSGSGSISSSSSRSMNSFRGVKMFLFDVTEAYRYMKAVQTFYF